MKVFVISILSVIVVSCKAEIPENDTVVKQSWTECARQYGLDPNNFAYVMNAKTKGVTGCLYKKIGLFKEDGTFNYDYKQSYPKLPERTKLDSILNGCNREANSDFPKLASCYNRETEGFVGFRKY